MNWLPSQHIRELCNLVKYMFSPHRVEVFVPTKEVNRLWDLSFELQFGVKSAIYSLTIC